MAPSPSPPPINQRKTSDSSEATEVSLVGVWNWDIKKQRDADGGAVRSYRDGAAGGGLASQLRGKQGRYLER